MKRNYAIIDFELGETKETSKLHFYLKDVKGETVLQDTLTQEHFKDAKAVPDVESYLKCKNDQALQYPAKEILYWRLTDLSHPLTQAIYIGALVALALFVMFAVCCFKACRGIYRFASKKEHIKKDE